MINQEGFRDLNRTPSPPQNTKRLALIGDSFIEAAQVSFENTASQVLENELNTSKKESFNDILAVQKESLQKVEHLL